MCDDEIHQFEGTFRVPEAPMSRRAFGVSAAAAASLSATLAHARATVVEKDVDVKMTNGVADCALFYPAGKGTWPAVLIWTDIMGLRPVFRDMGRRLAAQGYVVLVPNPFYRQAKAPVVGPDFDFGKAEDRAKVMPLAAAVTAPEAAHNDSVAYVRFLDSLPQVNKAKKAAVQGYCMGGPLAFRTAAAAPRRIAAVVTCHGGGLVTPGVTSPHLLIPSMKAEVYCAVAANDDARAPTDKDTLKAAFAAAGKTARVEVYDGCNHGWCVAGSQVYNAAGAERAWAELTALYERVLA